MIFLQRHNARKHEKGFLLIGVLIFSAIAIATVMAFVSWGISSSRLSNRVLHREESLEIAEAGIEYSRWFLAHYQSDFQLGTGHAGPYTYDFQDKDGATIGTYTITITPPSTGSTVVTIQSKGVVSVDPNSTRTIQVKLAIPSLAKYAVVANDDMRFGEGTVVYGPIHSNGGIRFDGLAYNIVTSAKASYDDPDHSGGSEFGVHTHLDTNGNINDSFRPLEAPPSTVQARTDVFKAGRQFPVPAVDFNGITNDLATIKSNAQSSGKYFAASGSLGYDIILKTNDTFDIYKVTALDAAPSNCKSDGASGWGTWSIKNKTLIGTYAFPSNGLIFTEDNLWIEGQIDTARLTIAAAAFPDNVNTRKSITVNNNLTYTNYDGQDVISLIAQNNINAGLESADDLRIDAALMAQNGRIGRYYYSSSCKIGGTNYYVRDTINLYGMIGSNQRYGFAYTNGTGYQTRIITYDTNLLYSPPPNFPLASDKYQIISWEELEE
ncbi:MAG TPA: hypothetical protein VG982_01750 [Candidatus Paceibacterota bacterium]|jgi:hypothetical protein|nr:hypothetical protein [Candidatus Paceibacterota bacterium]